MYNVTSLTFQDRTVCDEAKKLPRLLERLISPPTEFDVYSSLSSDRKNIESYIANKFFDEYGAELYHFMPTLISMRCQGSMSAALGINSSCEEHLFTEQYLDHSIENILSDKTSHSVLREDIVEIGNLVSTHRGASQLLFVVLANALKMAGYEWMVFTATREVTGIIKKLHCESFDLGRACPERLNGKVESWGSYYSKDPHIHAINLTSAIDAAYGFPVQSVVLNLYKSHSSDIASQLSGSGNVIRNTATNISKENLVGVNF